MIGHENVDVLPVPLTVPEGHVGEPGLVGSNVQLTRPDGVAPPAGPVMVAVKVNGFPTEILEGEVVTVIVGPGGALKVGLETANCRVSETLLGAVTWRVIS